MHIDRINCATIAAADLVLKNVERVVAPTTIPLKAIRSDLVPLFGIQWNRQVIGGLTANRFDDLLKNLRNRGLDSTTYNKLTALRQDAFTVSTDQPAEWLLWVPLIQRFRLQERCSWPSMYGTLPLLRQKSYSAPGNLAILPASVFESTFSAQAAIRMLAPYGEPLVPCYRNRAMETFSPLPRSASRPTPSCWPPRPLRSGPMGIFLR